MDAKRYKFFTPTHLIFGEGCATEVGQRAKALGGTTPAKAMAMKSPESASWPTRVEEMVRSQSHLPAVATLSLART